MFTVVWFGGPALAGMLLALVARFSWRRAYIPLVLGVVLAVVFVLVVYLRAPVDYAHDRSGCSDCGEYLGRWWEPGLVVFVVFVAYVCWSLGVFGGLVLRTAFVRVRTHRLTARG